MIDFNYTRIIFSTVYTKSDFFYPFMFKTTIKSANQKHLRSHYLELMGWAGFSYIFSTPFQGSSYATISKYVK